MISNLEEAPKKEKRWLSIVHGSGQNWNHIIKTIYQEKNANKLKNHATIQHNYCITENNTHNNYSPLKVKYVENMI